MKGSDWDLPEYLKIILILYKCLTLNICHEQNIYLKISILVPDKYTFEKIKLFLQCSFYKILTYLHNNNYYKYFVHMHNTNNRNIQWQS